MGQTLEDLCRELITRVEQYGRNCVPLRLVDAIDAIEKELERLNNKGGEASGEANG